MLPETQHLAAELQPALGMLCLRPTDSPVVNHADEDEGAAAAGGTAASTPLMELAISIRGAQGRSYDELIDVSALADRGGGGAGGGGSGSREQQSAAPPGDAVLGAPSRPSVVMVGDELLRYPQMHRLLERRRVAMVGIRATRTEHRSQCISRSLLSAPCSVLTAPLTPHCIVCAPQVETSVPLPHLILDHQSGVLLLDTSVLRRPGAAAAMVGQCETSYRSLWLLVLWDDGQRGGSSGGHGGRTSGKQPSGEGGGGEGGSGEGGGGGDAGDKGSGGGGGS